jgi:hypothetical protein
MTQNGPLVSFDGTELSNRLELQCQEISVERKINLGAYHLSLGAHGDFGEHWNLGFHREEIIILYM